MVKFTSISAMPEKMADSPKLLENNRKPTKFAGIVSSHLICPMCSNVFNNPVINVKCGHTFCKQCVSKQNGPGSNRVDGCGKCPVDNVIIDPDHLVLNRAIVAQIEDLDIFCCHGMRWSDVSEDYVLDPNGCQRKIKYGQRATHEDHCQFGLVSCPNSETICGCVRRGELQRHLEVCKNHLCPNSAKGCQYTGTKKAVQAHTPGCTFEKDVFTEVEVLRVANKKLEENVQLLTDRVAGLDNDKKILSRQVESCLSSHNQLQQKFLELEERVDRIVLSRKPSFENKDRLSLQFYGGSPGSSTTVSPPRSLKGETWTMPMQFKCIGSLRGHKKPVWVLKTKGDWLLSAGEDSVIKIWNLKVLAEGHRRTLTGHTDRIHALAVNERYLYSGGADQSIRMWKCDDFSQVHVAEGAHEQVIAAMVCTENFVFSSSHTVIKVWDALTLQELHSMKELYHWVRSLALNPRQDRLYSGSHNTIDIWDTRGKFNLVSKISHTYGSVYSLVVTHEHIIAGTYNQNIHMFDIESQQQLQKLSGHVGTIMAMDASPSGRFLFSASNDATVQVWNLDNLLPVQTLHRHEGSVNSVVIHKNFVLTGSEDSEIKVFKYFKMEMGFQPT